MSLTRAVLRSPVGDLTAAVVDGALTTLTFGAGRAAETGPDRCPIPGPDQDGPGVDEVAPEAHPVLAAVASQLDEYFAGRRTSFDLPLRPAGGVFERRVWSALREIPHGQTRSYGQVARQLGQPLAAQAVGAANGRNPIAVIIPCHRVIGADGSLTGYAGGLDRKRFLLDLEQPDRLF
ncbi:methylated-DNA--[protein]-cysteine S-methyltransferase [Pilimelia columellifera]|uniref:Methylated-DNA--protein-cysteine methyltransferase n=1 Tax=Pilimelia columellifera subsp. columellifera TaxID=706583 RepID=A0ABP6A2K7_9ACTN